MAIDLTRGTINENHISDVTLDYLTDLLGRPSQITDLFGQLTATPRPVVDDAPRGYAKAILHVAFFKHGIVADVLGRDPESVLSMTFVVSGRDPETISARSGTNKLLQVIEKLKLVPGLTEYSAFAGKFVPELTAGTKEKHLIGVFRSPEIQRAGTARKVDRWVVRYDKHILSIMFNAVTHFVEFARLDVKSEEPEKQE